MKTHFSTGRGDFTLRGKWAILVSVLYIALWLLLYSAAIKVAWEVLFGGLV